MTQNSLSPEDKRAWIADHLMNMSREEWMRLPLYVLNRVFEAATKHYVNHEEKSQIAKLAIAEARRSGKTIGRPRLNVTPEEVGRLRQDNVPIREIGKQLNISVTTAWRLFRRFRDEKHT